MFFLRLRLNHFHSKILKNVKKSWHLAVFLKFLLNCPEKLQKVTKIAISRLQNSLLRKMKIFCSKRNKKPVFFCWYLLEKLENSFPAAVYCIIEKIYWLWLSEILPAKVILAKRFNWCWTYTITFFALIRLLATRSRRGRKPNVNKRISFLPEKKHNKRN